MQIDIGFGGKVHPDAVQAEYPVILDLPTPMLRIYPPETVAAEKAEAMIHFGSLNKRIKDFYDAWRISQQFEFDRETSVEAIKRTVNNSGAGSISFDELIAALPGDDILEKQWHAFLRKSGVDSPPSLEDVPAAIGALVDSVLD